MSGFYFTVKNNYFLLCTYLTVTALLIVGTEYDVAFSYSNIQTHPGITERALERDEGIKSFLFTLGFLDDLETDFTLNHDYIYDSDLITDLDNFRKNFNDWIFSDECGDFGTRKMAADAGIVITDGKTFSLLDWFKLGSVLADAPIIRASDHFHDPDNNQGLDNSGHIVAKGLTGAVYIAGLIAEKLEQDLCYASIALGGTFDITGQSARSRVFSNDTGSPNYALPGNAWLSENYFSWEYARGYYYRALTGKTEQDREQYWILTAYSLGQMLHFLQDMAVPAHVRNDWIYEHFLA